MFAVIQTNGLFQQESISSWFNQNDHDNINDNRLLQNPKKKKKILVSMNCSYRNNLEKLNIHVGIQGMLKMGIPQSLTRFSTGNVCAWMNMNIIV